MVKVRLLFVPPGGGEVDYGLHFELPEIPRPGDYITITRGSGSSESEDFIVRRTWWLLNYPDTPGIEAKPTDEGRVKEIYVECEFAIGPFSSERHKKSAGKNAKEFDNSAY